MRIVGALVLALFSLGAQAEAETHLSLGLSGQLGADGCDYCGPENTVGPTLRAVWDVGARLRLGLLLEHQFYLGDGDYEYGATEQRVAGLLQLRLSPRVSFDIALGLSHYHGSFDRPEMPDCYGCGRYDDTTSAPSLQVGIAYEAPLQGPWSVVMSGGLLFRKNIGGGEDGHNFYGPELSLRVEAGLGLRL